MLRRGILSIVAALIAVACGANPDASTTVVSTEPTVPVTAPLPSVETPSTLSATTTMLTSAEPDESVNPENVSDQVVGFVAALADLLAETEYVDSVIDDPEVFVATGILFCEQLAGGTAPPDILTDYVETLTEGDIEEADDDSLTLAGSILGSAVGYFCPEHTELLEESL
ncbi:MAG: hypothetical protein O6951_10230 [Actinobacteria bacterium]|nr:hypothetical protein [Actinomycetota bacterium]